MSEIISDRKIFSLLEVTRSIQRTIAERYTSSYWIKAEMNKLNLYTHSGHCYPDLVEKQEGKVIAQIRASLWKEDFRRANQRFLEVLKEPLKDGIKILFLAKVQFDPVYGLSLNILDIDPIYSLGELEREKTEAIDKLTKEGIFNRNKAATLPLLPQRIAVISVETSKGYSDYLNVLEKNPWGYRFFNVLFPSLLQGEKAVGSILKQLRRIKKVAAHFDAVAIIRGGGGDVGLSSFNSYELSREVALFPIPVFTGIGHSTNETVVEMVSFRNAITPTELADFLLQKFHDFAAPVNRAEELIADYSRQLIKEEKTRLQHFMRYFQSMIHNRLLKSRHSLEGCSKAVTQESKFLIRKEQEKLAYFLAELKSGIAVKVEHEKDALVENMQLISMSTTQLFLHNRQSLQFLEKNVQILDPINILQRGFSITLDENGKAVKDAAQLHEKAILTTILATGKIKSIVEIVNPPEKL